jgi:hypothetical protein
MANPVNPNFALAKNHVNPENPGILSENLSVASFPHSVSRREIL